MEQGTVVVQHTVDVFDGDVAVRDAVEVIRVVAGVADQGGAAASGQEDVVATVAEDQVAGAAATDQKILAIAAYDDVGAAATVEDIVGGTTADEDVGTAAASHVMNVVTANKEMAAAFATDVDGADYSFPGIKQNVGGGDLAQERGVAEFLGILGLEAGDQGSLGGIEGVGEAQGGNTNDVGCG